MKKGIVDINKEVLRLALPSIVANITIPLVGLVDTAIAGHISDATAIGGIAVGTMLFDLLYWNFGFLRVGTSGMTAQAYGRGDDKGCAQLLAQSMSMAMIASVLLIPISMVLIPLCMHLIPCSSEVARFAMDYFEVRIWAAPATLSLFTLKGWFIGMQDTKSTMVCDIVVNMTNIVASYGLAVYTPLGAIGVAHGTLIAQYVGLVTGATILLYKYKRYTLNLNTWREWFSWRDMKRLVGLNVNLFVRSLCFMVVYVGFTALTSGYGDVLLAVSTIVMKLFMIFSYFIDGFAYAGEALVGRFVGQSDVMQDAQNIRPTTRVLMFWAVGVGLLFTLLYVVASPLFYKMMTSDVRVLEALHDFTPWVIAMPLISALAFMWDGVYIGATAGKQIRNAMIYAAISFVLGYWLTREQLGIHAVFVGYFLHLVARVVYLTIEWRVVYKNILNKTSYETIRES